MAVDPGAKTLRSGPRETLARLRRALATNRDAEQVSRTEARIGAPLDALPVGPALLLDARLTPVARAVEDLGPAARLRSAGALGNSRGGLISRRH